MPPTTAIQKSYQCWYRRVHGEVQVKQIPNLLHGGMVHPSYLYLSLVPTSLNKAVEAAETFEKMPWLV